MALSSKPIKIRDTDWKIYVMSSKAYDRKHGKDSVGITFGNTKEIYFKRSTLNLKTVVHELFHAYCSTLYIESADLSISQYEEIIAQFLEDYIVTIYVQAETLFKSLTE